MSLSDKMGFDHVVKVLPGGEVADAENIYAPDVLAILDSDGAFSATAEAVMLDELERDGWEALTGYTRQSMYRGAIMHSSEQIGGGLERDILENPGIYVSVVVMGMRTLPDDYPLPEPGEERELVTEPIGWAVLRKTGDS